jgi:hypothetical protein
VSGAKEGAAVRAASATRAPANAVDTALGTGRNPWPAVTNDVGLANLWAQLATADSAVIAGFERISKGLTGKLSPTERRARADAMAVLLGEYRATWRQMLSSLGAAKGLGAYASCRDEMIDHANGLRTRDGLIANLIGAVRRGDPGAVKRAFAAQRTRGAANRRLAAPSVRA